MELPQLRNFVYFKFFEILGFGIRTVACSVTCKQVSTTQFKCRIAAITKPGKIIRMKPTDEQVKMRRNLANRDSWDTVLKCFLTGNFDTLYNFVKRGKC